MKLHATFFCTLGAVLGVARFLDRLADWLVR